MKKWIAAILSALLLALSACAPTATVGPDAPIGPSPTPEVIVTPAPTAAPTPEPSPEPEATPTIWDEQTMRTTFVDEKGGAYFDMAFSFPYAAAPGYEAVNDYFAELLEDYAEEARGYAADSKVFGYPYGADDQYLYANTRGIYKCDRFLTFDFSRNCWLGGPHPYYEFFSVNFDLSTGMALTLPDLFTDWPSARAQILVEIKAQIPEQFLAHLNGNPPSEDVDYKKMGEAVDFYLDDAPFALRNEGVELCFNKGRIASQADTPYYFTIPYEAFSDLWTLGEPPVFTTEAEFEEFIPELPDAPTIWGEQSIRAGCYDNSGNRFDVDLSFPFAGASGVVYDTINEYYRNILRECIAQLPENAKSAVGHSDTLWHISGFVPYESSRFLSTAYFEDWFAGGLWPQSTYYAFFEKESGEMVNFDDLFSDPAQARERILPLLDAALHEQYNWRSEEMLPRAIEHLGEQFYLTDAGIELYYNVYDIGTYADSDYHCLISYEAVEDILRYERSAFMPTVQTYDECLAKLRARSPFKPG